MADTPEPKRGSLLKWIALGGIVVVVLGGGVVGFMWWQSYRTPAAAAAADSQAQLKPAGGVIVLEPFLVNLADTNAARFARISLRLVVATKEEAKEATDDLVKQTRLRSAILDLLTQQTADRVITPEGKAELRKEMAERAARILGHEVSDVLFTDFVVQ